MLKEFGQVNKNFIETIIGAMVLAVAGLFLIFAYNQADVKKVDGYQVKAKFDRIDGISLGSEVRMSGIKVGTVSKATLDTETYFALVLMDIRPDVKIPDDTSIAVSSDGLLGEKFLTLSPGGSENMLKAGGELLTTQGSIDLMGLVGQMIFSKTEKDEDTKK